MPTTPPQPPEAAHIHPLLTAPRPATAPQPPATASRGRAPLSQAVPMPNHNQPPVGAWTEVPVPRRKLLIALLLTAVIPAASTYPAHWFTPITDPHKPAWEILPQAAKPGEVILSKRNELGILSNFAATPFTLHGRRYASVEGFWQMMLYPESPDDPRAMAALKWPHTRAEVAQMTAFEAKAAGDIAEEYMRKLRIDWVTYQGHRMLYRSPTKGEHYRLIVDAMRAKLEQNPKVREILLATGNLILRPDHIQESNAPPEWAYFQIWMDIRASLPHH